MPGSSLANGTRSPSVESISSAAAAAGAGATGTSPQDLEIRTKLVLQQQEIQRRVADSRDLSQRLQVLVPLLSPPSPSAVLPSALSDSDHSAPQRASGGGVCLALCQRASCEASLALVAGPLGHAKEKGCITR